MPTSLDGQHALVTGGGSGIGLAVANAGIANAVRFLCGPESSWITGVSLSVDGGHHLRRGPNYEPFSRAMFGDELTDGRF